jgi:hypothetical protein
MMDRWIELAGERKKERARRLRETAKWGFLPHIANSSLVGR